MVTKKIKKKETGHLVEFSSAEIKLLQEVRLSAKEVVDKNSIIIGIYFGTNGDVVATDARRLVVLRKKYDPSYGDRIVSIDFKVKKTDLVTFDFEKNEWVIITSDLQKTSCKAEVIDGRFPDYKQVIPTADPVYRTQLDTALLPRNVKLTMDFMESGTAAVRCKLRGEDFDEIKDDITFIVMPITVKCGGSGLLTKEKK